MITYEKIRIRTPVISSRYDRWGNLNSIHFMYFSCPLQWNERSLCACLARWSLTCTTWWLRIAKSNVLRNLTMTAMFVIGTVKCGPLCVSPTGLLYLSIFFCFFWKWDQYLSLSLPTSVFWIPVSPTVHLITEEQLGESSGALVRGGTDFRANEGN